MEIIFSNNLEVTNYSEDYFSMYEIGGYWVISNIVGFFRKKCEKKYIFPLKPLEIFFLSIFGIPPEISIVILSQEGYGLFSGKTHMHNAFKMILNEFSLVAGMSTKLQSIQNDSTYFALKNGKDITSVAKGVANVVRGKISIHLLFYEFHNFFTRNTLNGVW